MKKGAHDSVLGKNKRCREEEFMHHDNRYVFMSSGSHLPFSSCMSLLYVDKAGMPLNFFLSTLLLAFAYLWMPACLQVKKD